MGGTVGNGGTNRLFKGPVFSPDGTFIDPAADKFPFHVAQGLPVRVRGWHHLVFVLSDESLPDLAPCGIVRFDRADSVELAGRFGLQIETQVGFALPGVGTVTVETAVREDREDFAAEIYRCLSHLRSGREICPHEDEDPEGSEGRKQETIRHRERSHHFCGFVL